MSLSPVVTDLAQLKDRPAVALLTAWRSAAVQGAKLDRDELCIHVDRASIREACVLLQSDPATKYNFLSDITCLDLYPSEPRFEVCYHLLSHARKERVRLKVRLA